MLAELLPELIEDALTTPAPGESGNGHRAEPPAVPQVPAPPIAKVHRPTGWRPSAPAEAPAAEPEPGGAAVEHVERHTDAELEAFVNGLARRLQSPDERDAILSGRVRFWLAQGLRRARPGRDDPGRVRRRPPNAR